MSAVETATVEAASLSPLLNITPESAMEYVMQQNLDRHNLQVHLREVMHLKELLPRNTFVQLAGAVISLDPELRLLKAFRRRIIFLNQLNALILERSLKGEIKAQQMLYLDLVDIDLEL